MYHIHIHVHTSLRTILSVRDCTSVILRWLYIRWDYNEMVNCTSGSRGWARERAHPRLGQFFMHFTRIDWLCTVLQYHAVHIKRTYARTYIHVYTYILYSYGRGRTRMVSRDSATRARALQGGLYWTDILWTVLVLENVGNPKETVDISVLCFFFILSALPHLQNPGSASELKYIFWSNVLIRVYICVYTTEDMFPHLLTL